MGEGINDTSSDLAADSWDLADEEYDQTRDWRYAGDEPAIPAQTGGSELEALEAESERSRERERNFQTDYRAAFQAMDNDPAFAELFEARRNQAVGEGRKFFEYKLLVDIYRGYVRDGDYTLPPLKPVADLVVKKPSQPLVLVPSRAPSSNHGLREDVRFMLYRWKNSHQLRNPIFHQMLQSLTEAELTQLNENMTAEQRNAFFDAVYKKARKAHLQNRADALAARARAEAVIKVTPAAERRHRHEPRHAAQPKAIEAAHNAGHSAVEMAKTVKTIEPRKVVTGTIGASVMLGVAMNAAPVAASTLREPANDKTRALATSLYIHQAPTSQLRYINGVFKQVIEAKPAHKTDETPETQNVAAARDALKAQIEADKVVVEKSTFSQQEKETFAAGAAAAEKLIENPDLQVPGLTFADKPSNDQLSTLSALLGKSPEELQLIANILNMVSQTAAQAAETPAPEVAQPTAVTPVAAPTHVAPATNDPSTKITPPVTAKPEAAAPKLAATLSEADRNAIIDPLHMPAEHKAFLKVMTLLTVQARLDGAKINPAATTALAIKQTGWGESTLAKEANNYFALPVVPGWKGETIVVDMTAPDGTKTPMYFKKYDSPQASIADFAAQIESRSQYADTARNADDSAAFILGLFNKLRADNSVEAAPGQKGAMSFAASSSYAAELTRIMQQYNLDKLAGVGVAAAHTTHAPAPTHAVPLSPVTQAPTTSAPPATPLAPVTVAPAAPGATPAVPLAPVTPPAAEAPVTPAAPNKLAGVNIAAINKPGGFNSELVQGVVNHLITVNGLTPMGAAYMAGNFLQESGLRPEAVGDHGEAHGIGQWHAPRDTGLPADLMGQLDFAVNVDAPHSGGAALLKAARDPHATEADFAKGDQAYERYGPGKEGRRVEYGRIIYQQMMTPAAAAPAPAPAPAAPVAPAPAPAAPAASVAPVKPPAAATPAAPVTPVKTPVAKPPVAVAPAPAPAPAAPPAAPVAPAAPAAPKPQTPEKPTSLEGARDLGTHEVYVNGKKAQKRLYAITGIPSSSEESNPKSQWYVQGSNGEIIVSEDIAPKVVQLKNEADAAGVKLRAVSSLRTYVHQQQLFDAANHDRNRVASPGDSAHNSGEAIDFVLDGYANNTPNAFATEHHGARTTSNPRIAPHSQVWNFLKTHAPQLGLNQYSNEPWHWDPWHH
ncbi:MAG: tape measure domain protein [Candidatus Saccharibacteria bacterium]|nr:tape measure domain protein [Candidatus Saccharibacteria bacterium]